LTALIKLLPLEDDEGRVVAQGRWFSRLPRSSQDALLQVTTVTRHEDGERLAGRGRPCAGLLACASGAIHVSTTTSGGIVLAIGYVKPGVWLCPAGVLETASCGRDAHARGAVTLLTVAVEDLRSLLISHPEFYQAVLQLHARETRRLFERIEDLVSLQLRARLGKQLYQLARGFGVASEGEEGGIRIGLNLSQGELGQLVGGSRQRVNQEIKQMEREGVITVTHQGLIVRDSQALKAIAHSRPHQKKAVLQ